MSATSPPVSWRTAPRTLLPASRIPGSQDCGKLVYEPHVVSASKAKEMLGQAVHVSAREEWTGDRVAMFGRVHEMQRRVAYFGDYGTKYRYSGQMRAARSWDDSDGFLPPIVRQMRQLAESKTGVRFHFCVCNFYPDGKSAMGWHSDDEADLDPTTPIVSMSLGAERDFFLRLKTDHKKKLTVMLESGSMLIMHAPMQQYWQHSLPARSKILQARVNFTFRCLRQHRLVVVAPPGIAASGVAPASTAATATNERKRRHPSDSQAEDSLPNELEAQKQVSTGDKRQRFGTLDDSSVVSSSPKSI